MKIRFYRSPGDDGTGGSAAEKVVDDTAKKEPTFVPLTEEQMLAQPSLTDAEFANKSLDELGKPADPKAAEAGKATEEGKPAAGVPAAKKDEKGEEGKPAAAAPVVKTGDESADTFKIEPPVVTNAEEQEVTTTWKDTAKDLVGKDIELDDYDALKNAVAARITEERQAGIEEGKKLATKVEASALPEPARDLFEFLSVPGNTLEMFLNPLTEIDQYLALDNEQLVRKDLELKNLKPDIIDKKIEKLREDDALDLTGEELRQTLTNAKENRKAKLIVEARQKNEARTKETNETIQREDTQIVEAMRKRNKLLGGTLSNEDIDKAAQKWKTDYRKRLLETKDPELIADSILFAEYGKAAEAGLRKHITTGKNLDVIKKLSNIEQLPNAGGAGGQRETPAGNDEDPFDKWKQGLHPETADQSK